MVFMMDIEKGRSRVVAVMNKGGEWRASASLKY